MFNIDIEITTGIIITNSTSKTKKMTAIRKKCLENGIREDSIGSNPHSKGEFFSRSIILFIEITYNKIIKINNDNNKKIE